MARLTLLDTTVVIDIMRAFPDAIAFADRLDRTALCSEITRVEVERGLRGHERRCAQDLLDTFNWILLDAPIARRAGELGRRYRRSHVGIGLGDLVVAATAEELGAALATSNVKHFPMFRGLRPPY